LAPALDEGRCHQGLYHPVGLFECDEHEVFQDGENNMKNLTGYLVAATLALGATLVAIDAHAAVVCGQNGCRHVYPHRSQWPVGM
jgi:hypothetical protein